MGNQQQMCYKLYTTKKTTFQVKLWYFIFLNTQDDFCFSFLTIANTQQLFPCCNSDILLRILTLFYQNSEFTSHNTDFILPEFWVYISQYWLYFTRILSLHLTILTLFLEFCVKISQFVNFSWNSEFPSRYSDFFLSQNLGFTFHNYDFFTRISISQFWHCSWNSEIKSHNFDISLGIRSLHLVIMTFFSFFSKFWVCILQFWL